MCPRGVKEITSLYADTLTRIKILLKNVSPSQDKLNYVYETTPINKWTLFFHKEAFNFMLPL